MKVLIYVLMAAVPTALADPPKPASEGGVAHESASGASAQAATADPEKAAGAASTPSTSTSGSDAGGIGGVPASGDTERSRRIMPWFALLDLDRDGRLSRLEMANAPATLLKFDKDHDGHLSAEELRTGPISEIIENTSKAPAPVVPEPIGKTTPASAAPPSTGESKVEPQPPVSPGTNPQ